MTDKSREEYLKTKKGKESQEKAREKYDLKRYGETVERRKIKNGKGYEYKLIG